MFLRVNVCTILQGSSISRALFCAKQVREKRGKISKPVKIVHNAHAIRSKKINPKQNFFRKNLKVHDFCTIIQNFLAFLGGKRVG